MISELVLKYLKGERLVMRGRYAAPSPAASRVALTEPSRLLFGVDREAYKLVLNACREAKAAEPQDVEVA